MALDDDAAVADYLRLVYALIRADAKPFQIIDALSDLPMDPAEQAALAAEIGAAITPPRFLDGDLARDGWQRIEAWGLCGLDLIRLQFRVNTSGDVDVEQEQGQLVATEPPVRRCRFDGPLRFPPPAAETC